VGAALDDKTEAVIRELEAQHKEARRSAEMSPHGIGRTIGERLALESE